MKSVRYEGKKIDISAWATWCDFVFAGAALFKLLPAVRLSRAIWIWTGLIAAIKLINVISGFVMKKLLIAVHSPANKLTGVVLFCLPLTMSVIDVRYSAAFACAVATYAAVQEGHFVRTGAV